MEKGNRLQSVDISKGILIIALSLFCWFIYRNENQLYYFDMKPVYYKEFISALLIPCAFGMVLARLVYWMEKIKWIDSLNRFLYFVGKQLFQSCLCTSH